MDYIKYVIDKFETFLKRAFLPSMVFYFFIISFSISFNENFLKRIISFVNEKNFIWVFVVFSIGISYFLSVLHQIVFDNNIKENYETKFFWTKENDILRDLRKKVEKNILNSDKNYNILDFKEKYNDYLLYQIIGEKVDTKRYVDDTKTYGIIFLSFILAIIMFLSKSEIILELSEQIIVPCCFYGLLGIIFLFFLIFDIIKAKYRSRALRLYINYLKKGKKMNLTFKKIKRKPSFVDMAEVNAKEAREVLENGIDGKNVSFSDEDKEKVLKAKDDEVVGFVATDGESFWFINYEYAKNNYEIR